MVWCPFQIKSTEWKYISITIHKKLYPTHSAQNYQCTELSHKLWCVHNMNKSFVCNYSNVHWLVPTCGFKPNLPIGAPWMITPLQGVKMDVPNLHPTSLRSYMYILTLSSVVCIISFSNYRKFSSHFSFVIVPTVSPKDLNSWTFLIKAKICRVKQLTLLWRWLLALACNFHTECIKQIQIQL